VPFFGWPEEEWEVVNKWVQDNQHVAFSKDALAGKSLAQHFSEYVKAHLEKHRAILRKKDSTIDTLLKTEIDGEYLSDDQIVSILRNWVAGHGTVAAD
jgi:cytochrome P450